ncbi:ABC transporter six-transmembrane domain-containing protein [Kangiella sp. TOML190]|uniref:ABC transporter six-transmembrane domain-containing protein n=1 Tax=Kangiella sp. TOML190 TaxID=2931351 RepID=UPI0020401F65|nr:ABC transporter six-transmembrane domain-containing protein [Kangiella sp. TOML190]
MTLFSIYKRYKWRISLTMALVGIEAVAMLLLPLVIGFAIDDLLADSYSGLWQLTLVGVTVLTSGSLRRFYDTRVYSSIYVDLSSETAEVDKESSTSRLNARITMLKELVEFFENSFPELIFNLIGLVGTVIILYSLDYDIFLGCLAILVFMFIVFGLTGKRTKQLNHQYNDVFEAQVEAIEQRSKSSIRGYMKQLMAWNIRLSDLETIVFGLVWFGMVGLIIFSVVEAVGDGNIKVGLAMSTIMYVFQFAEGSGVLPLHFQQFLRLTEISSRLKATRDSAFKSE